MAQALSQASVVLGKTGEAASDIHCHNIDSCYLALYMTAESPFHSLSLCHNPNSSD